MPVVERQDIVLNWNGSPTLEIETIDIAITKFCYVYESFALAEGENDSLEAWRRDNQQYYERNDGFSFDMLLVCERFNLIEELNSICKCNS